MRSPFLFELPDSPLGKSGWPWTEQSQYLPLEMPDGSPWPRISIITPSFNQGMFIEETIRSVLLQGYPNLEYIVIDGGSTDATIEVIKNYEPWLSYWVSEPDRGQSHAINKGFSRATGELIGWINSDDIYFPNAIKTVITHWLANGRPYSLITGTKLKGNPTLETISRLEQRPYSVHHLVEKNIIEQPSTFFPLELIRNVRGVDERFRMAMDYDLWLRMTRQGAGMSFIDADLAMTRIHPMAKTSRFQRLSLTEALQSTWRNYRILPASWLKKVITAWVVPQGLNSKSSEMFFYSIRDILLILVVHMLRWWDLLEYHEDKFTSPKPG